MEENNISLLKIIQIIDSGNKNDLLNYDIIKYFITNIYETYEEFKNDNNDNLKIKLLFEIENSIRYNKEFIDKNIGYILNYLRYLNEDAIFISSTISPNTFIYFNSKINNSKIANITKNNTIPISLFYPNESRIKRIFDIILMSN